MKGPQRIETARLVLRPPREHTEFPNLAPGRKSDVLSYVRLFPGPGFADSH